METKIQYKTCTRCKQIKEESEFNKNKNAKDGLQSYCRLCQKELGKKYEKENRARRNKYKVAYNAIEENRIVHAMRSRLCNAIKSSNQEHTLDLIGCTKEKFKQWLEFTKKYYVSENYSGQIDIEHMIEFKNIDLAKKENRAKVNNWKNLRYMSHCENIYKSNKSIKFKDVAKQLYLIICFEKGVKPNEKFCKYERMY